MSKRRIVELLISLMLVADEERDPRPGGCPMCGHHEKTSTGECAFCGVYVCAECKNMHFGEPGHCPGEGVPVPSKEAFRG